MFQPPLRYLFFAATALAALSGYAADVIRQGVTRNIQPTTPTKQLQYKRCPAGQYLVGVNTIQTDRMIGYWQKCTAVASYGVWSDGNQSVAYSLGASKGGDRIVAKTCPDHYFIVGLAATLGSYSKDSYGAAQPVPAPMLADLQPVCRQLVSPGAIYQLPRGYFENAENNSLSDVAFDGLNGQRSCPAGQAAVGLAFIYNGERNEEITNVFRDAALICERMWGVPPGAAKAAKSKVK